jgi:hypothetical protein
MLYCINNGHETRRKILDEHLKIRGIYDSFDVHWTDGWKKDDPFIRWLHEVFAPHVAVEGLSGHVKWFESMSKFLETGEEYFLNSDDDVVFPENWQELFDKLTPRPINIVSMGVNFHLPYEAGYTVTNNIGGMECTIFSRDMVTFILDNIDFGQCLDIVIGAMMNHKKLQLAITPICHQTSILDRHSTYSHNTTTYSKDWKKFTLEYKPSGLKYTNLKSEFQNFMKRKTTVEDAYFKRFATRLDIWNVEYIEKQYLVLSSTIASPVRPNAKIISSKSA